MSSLKAWALGLMCWAGVVLYAAPPPSTNVAAPARGRIVILGDSITAGYGLAEPGQAYPALLQRKIDAARLPFEVVNAGVSGDTTAGGLRRVDWALGRGAEVLVVALGGNDGLRGIAPGQMAGNLTGIIKRARAKAPGIAIVVAAMQMPPSMGVDYAREFASVFPRVAQENTAGLVPFLLEGVGGSTKLNQADGIHPTPAGQQRVAETVWKVLEPVLRGRTAAVP